MAVALSSLRVTSDFDASGYARGAAEKVAADAKMIAADRASNAALAQADAAMAKAIPGVSALSRSLLDGYGAGQTFEAQIRKIGNAVDRGLGLDRAGVLLDSVYRKFGLTADSAALAQKGFVSIVPAVDQLNSRLAAEVAFADDLAAAVQRLNAAQRVQATINASVGIGANDNSAGRAADMAALGQSLDGLRAKYSPLFAAQRQYLDTLRELNSLEAKVALTETERAVAIARKKAEFASQVQSIRDNAGAIDDLAKSHAGLSTQAMAMQHSLRSSIEMIVMGQSPTTVLASQFNHLAYAATGPGGIKGAFTDATSVLAGILTPTRLLGVGVAATGALAVASISSWETYALQLDDTARAVGTARIELAKLQSASTVRGIDGGEFAGAMQTFGKSVFDAKNNMGSLAEVFRVNNVHASTFDSYLSTAADLIKNAGNDQQRLSLLQQMGLPASMQWVRLLSGGADGIRAAKEAMTQFAGDESMILKAREIDEALNKARVNFTTGWRNATVDGVGFFEALSNKATAALMRIPGIGTAIPTNILRNALNDVAAGYNVGSRLTASSSVDDFYKGLGSNAPGNTKPATGGNTNNPDLIKDRLAKEQTYLGLLGQTTSASEARRQVELQLQAAAISGVTIDAKRAEVLKRLAEENARGTYQIKAQIDQTNIQAATIGLAVGAAAEYTARMNLLTEAERNHKDLTALDRAEIDAQAKALGEAAQAAATRQIRADITFGQRTSLLSPEDVQVAQQLKGIYPDVAAALGSVEAAGLRTNQALSGLSSSISNDLVSGLTDMTTGAKSTKDAFSDMATSILREIEKMIIQLTIVGPLMRSLQGAFGGGGFGSSLGSLGITYGLPGTAGSNLFGPAAPSAKGNVFGESNVIPFARGGAFSNLVVNAPTFFRFANGGAMQNGVMGEAGPEAVMPLRRGPDGRLGVAAHGSDAGSSAMSAIVNVYNAPAGSTAQSRVSRAPNGEMQVDVVLKNAVRGVISDDLAAGIGVAPIMKKFASLGPTGFGGT